MSNENTGSVTATVVLTEQNPSFLEEKVQLQKLSKELSKASKEAIEILLSLLTSKDERIRMQAAIKLLEFEIDVKKAISQDQMQRLIAEIKLNRDPQTTKIPLEADGKKRPIVDFSTIRQID
jgi:HEAT repeat protein